MAYMGRGGFSSINGRGQGSGRVYYRGGLFRMYYYIPLDNTYVIFQMIASFIIITVAGITFLTIYKPSIIDPLEDTKKMIMNVYIITILSLVVITILANYFSKNKNTLLKRLFVILVIAIITILVFFGFKTNLDSTYNKDKFEQKYTQEHVNEKNSNNKSKFDIGLTGMQIKTEKEYYVDECVKAYNIFSIRMYGIVALNILLIILLIYQLSKVSKIQEKQDRLTKDDAIIYDEEENVKY